MMNRRQAYWRMTLILFIFTLMGLTTSIWLPLHKAPDESAHFRYARFIAQAGRLPLTQAERNSADYRSNQPPLYHIFFAALAGWSDSEAPPQPKYVWQSPRFEIARELLDTKRLANTEDELFPFKGPILMWHLGRIVALAMSVGTIMVAFFTTLQILPKNYWMAVVSAAILAFLPTFIFISGSLSDDPMVGLWIGLYFFFLVKIVRNNTRTRNFILTGLFMGLAVTTKNSAIILPLELVMVFAFLAWKQKWGWLKLVKNVALVAVISMLASSWWYSTIIIYFNQIKEYGLVSGLVKPLLAGGVNASEQYVAYVLSSGEVGIGESPELMADPFWVWAVHLYQTFWVGEVGFFPLSPWAHIAVGLVSVFSAVAMIKVWLRFPARRIWVGLFVAHVIFFLVFPLVRHTIQGNANQTGQGRHLLFPIATIFPLLITYGWQGWLSKKRQRLFALALTGGLLAWSLVQLVYTVRYPLLYLPVKTTADATSAINHRVDQTFGNNPTLPGYNLEPVFPENELKLQLYWQTSAYLDQDYQVRVQLVQGGAVYLDWTAFPVNGRYPTRIWESREIVRDDLNLPLFDLPPGEYQILVQLVGSHGPLPVNGQDTLTLDTIIVPESLPKLKPKINLPVEIEGRKAVTGATIWQGDEYRLIDLPQYSPRMVIPLVWQGQPAGGERVQWLLVDEQGNAFAAREITTHLHQFFVAPNWIPGMYNLRAEVWRGDEVVASNETGPALTVKNERPRLMQSPSVSQTLDANFADHIKLLGYNLPNRTLKNGDGVPVTLYWQGLRTMDTSYTVFVKLLDEQQNAWGNSDRYPADGYQTIYWLENEVVIDGFELPVDPTAPDGIYWLNVGLYKTVNQADVSLPLVTGGASGNVTSVTFGPVKIGHAPPGSVLPDAAPDYPLNADFGDVIRLLGYSQVAQTVDSLAINLYWQSVAPADANYTAFVHIKNRQGDVVAQMDRPPANGRYPTSVWSAGEIVPDKITVPLPPNLPAGEYSAVIGLYNFATGKRLPTVQSADGGLKLFTFDIE